MMCFATVRRRVVWMVAGTAVLVCAMGRAQVRSANSPEAFRIAGILVNAVTGEPVRRGMVQALDNTGHAVGSSTTDAEGRFALDHLAAAKYQLTASKRGYRTASYDEHDEFATSIVTGPGQDTTHLNYKLTPNAILHGVVTSDDGEPVANAMGGLRPLAPSSDGSAKGRTCVCRSRAGSVTICPRVRSVRIPPA